MDDFFPATSEELDFIQSCKPADFDFFINACIEYQKFLYQTNEQFNLTRIPAEEFWSKHVCDSLCLALMKPEIRNKRFRLCDVGCGAGLPALILAAAFPNLYINAIDSRGKKANFVAQAAEQMKLSNMKAFQARANELAHQNDYRHSFNIVTARAVGTADFLLKESTDLLNTEGELILYRTPVQAEPEYAELQKRSKKFPVTLTKTLTLPGNAGTRMFMILEPRNHKKCLNSKESSSQ